jgi:hypothetical protein
MPKPSHHPRASRRPRRHTGFLLMVAAGLLVTAILVVGNSTGHAQTISRDNLPKDASSNCSVAKKDFDVWLKNGRLQPADSVNFPDGEVEGNCDFYKWSEQMFLWLTSPDPASKNGGRIIDSAEFYDVSLPDAYDKRTFLPHDPRAPIRTFHLRDAQAGPHGLQVLFDRAGKMFEIASSRKAPSGKPLLLDQFGKLVEVGSARMKAGKPVFLDKAGRPIANPKPIPEVLAAVPARLLEGGKAISMAYELTIGKTSIFLDANGEVINTAVGQAGTHGVLMAQNHSLVYYVTMVNDVFAYFFTKENPGGKPLRIAQFPTTQSEVEEVSGFASSRGNKVPEHPQALAIEVKSAWVEVEGLEAAGLDPSTYITMEANIPVYVKGRLSEWTLDRVAPTKRVKLAMVGMHVVGSARNNPEMLWATFEHFGNAPNAQYQYVANDKTKKTVAQETVGFWLFSRNGATSKFNVMNMQTTSDSRILALEPANAIMPSDTLSMKPWGGAFDLKPNNKVTSTAASNSQIIAINNGVLGWLPAGDIRKNYFMRGNTWTKGGAAPTEPYPGSGEEQAGQEVGTSQLANSAMETYDQGTPYFSKATNCFSCHKTNTTEVSHIYEDMKPLPPG